MAELQEVFSSSESKEELEAKLVSAGFKLDYKNSLASYFLTEDISVCIQENFNNKKENSVKASHNYCFVLELYKPLKEFEKNDSLFKFFRSLKEPRAHGICGRKPKYKIAYYLKN